MYYGGFSEQDARKLPIYKVRWWINRLNEEREKQNKNQGNQNPGLDLNSVEGMSRNALPNKQVRMR